MTRDLGVWTAPDCALVLIDYQEEMFEVLPSIPSELHGDSSLRPQSREIVMPTPPPDTGPPARVVSVEMRRGLVELEPRRGWLQPRPRGRPRRTIHHPVPAHTPGP
jgi:hypothetical protein